MCAVAASVLTVGCADDTITGPSGPRKSAVPVVPIAVPGVSSAAPLSPSPLAFATYEGSGEVVHPDVVTFAQPWNGSRYWAAITPYPNSKDRFENPSIFASTTGDAWSAPAGVKNPVETTQRGHLSDPDMVYEPTRNELRLYYREVEYRDRGTKKERHVADHVWMVSSANGTTWSAPKRVVSTGGLYVVSPSVTRDSSGTWRMYAINAGTAGCTAKSTSVSLRQSTDGLQWGGPRAVGLVQSGYLPWHLDVEYVAERGEYWALVAAYPKGTDCHHNDLFLATSRDGVQWTTYPAPVLARGAIPQFAATVYRSTFAYEPGGKLTVWFSGARQVRAGTSSQPEILAWSGAVTHTTPVDLLAHVQRKRTATPLAVTATATASGVSAGEMP